MLSFSVAVNQNNTTACITGKPSHLCSLGDEEMVAWILDSFPSIADISNANGNLAVHFAAASGTSGVLLPFEVWI